VQSQNGYDTYSVDLYRGVKGAALLLLLLLHLSLHENVTMALMVDALMGVL
jgi:hypothetical protein